jgi:selenocysteine-specific elongation factor
MSEAPPLTLGTAGHIDHGKTALIRALTGVDTDRLPQERDRGISIELGYAGLDLGAQRRISVVDVPGHERFVRTMVAGATGIDLYLMAVAADDGVMPQTREHASVLRALGVNVGVIAVTKSDLADPELAALEACELLPGAEAVAVSARTGEGLSALRVALARAAASVRGRSQSGLPARLHIDRVFTIRGAGTVVTGTLWSGTIAVGDALSLLPSGRHARARGVQVHDSPMPQAAAGQRVAVNLTGVGVEEVTRGDVLCALESPLAPTYRVDAELRFEDEEPEHGDRVTVHHGTRESPARLAWLGGRFWQLRCEAPLMPLRGDRVVIRKIAPPDTLGGGSVLDPNPRKHGAGRELLVALQRLSRGEPGMTQPPAPEPARPGPPAAPALAPLAPLAPLSERARALGEALRDAGCEPPLDTELDGQDLAALRAHGVAVRVSRTLHYHRDVLAQVRERVIALAAHGDGSVTLANVRDELGTSRKFAQALLEHLDAEKVTVRRGEAHVVRASARAAHGAGAPRGGPL